MPEASSRTAPAIADFRIADRMMTSLTRHASMVSADQDVAADKRDVKSGLIVRHPSDAPGRTRAVSQSQVRARPFAPGSVIVNVEPWPGWLLTAIVP